MLMTKPPISRMRCWICRSINPGTVIARCEPGARSIILSAASFFTSAFARVSLTAKDIAISCIVGLRPARTIYSEMKASA